MTKFLQELLTSTHPLFPQVMSQLERSTGYDGVDVRLIADITHKAHEIMRGISLDTADSTARELYLALNSYAMRAPSHELLYDADFVLLKVEDEVVSFNLIDVIENAHHELPFDQRLISHGQRALRGEIMQRYHDHPRTDENTTIQLAVDAGFVESTDLEYPSVKSHVITKNTAPSILAIGDIFTDAFIKLDEEYSVVETGTDGKEWLKLPFGSKPPYEQVDIIRSVGPSPNAAVSCARIGLNVQLMAWLGDDEHGRESLAHLKSEGIDTSSMITQPDSISSYWYVLRHGSDRTMLVKSEPYDYAWQAPARMPDWIYLAYIGEDSWSLHEGLDTYLGENPNIKFVFQPATYHFEWGVEKLKGLYEKAHMVVMNREEAMQVTGKPHEDLKALADGLHQLGPNIVVITDGSHGSYASFDGRLVTIPNYPDPAPPLDRTGAGDAFASSITAALALGHSVEKALTWAPINSMSVVQKLGAQAGLLTKDELLKFLDEAPEDYIVTEIKE